MCSEYTLLSREHTQEINYPKKNGPVAKKRDLRIYANSEDQDQTAHPRSLVRILTVRLYNI